MKDLTAREIASNAIMATLTEELAIQVERGSIGPENGKRYLVAFAEYNKDTWPTSTDHDIDYIDLAAENNKMVVRETTIFSLKSSAVEKDLPLFALAEESIEIFAETLKNRPALLRAGHHLNFTETQDGSLCQMTRLSVTRGDLKHILCIATDRNKGHLDGTPLQPLAHLLVAVAETLQTFL